MEFVENKGQWDEKIQYKGDFKAGNFFLQQKGFTVVLHNVKDLNDVSMLGHGEVKGPVTLHSFAYMVDFLDASDEIKVTPEKLQDLYNNYIIGNDPKKWASKCKIFHEITYKNVYPNIDVHYHSDANKLKYDFIIHPGGNVSSIAMQFRGPELSIKGKELLIKTPVGDLKELYPYTYQTSGNGRQQVECKYVLKNNVLTFSVKDYDPSQTLVIDPTIIFSSFSGSTADNWGYTATPGHDGCLYAGGIVFAEGNTGLPVTPGAFQTSYGGGQNENNFPGYDIGIFKYSPTGNARVYATYLGGGGNEQPHSLIEDGQGNLIIAGRTTSNNFPATTHIGPGGGYDIFITKLSPSGAGLIGSVVIGGTGNDGVNIRPKYQTPQGTDAIRRNYGDDARSEVIYDGSSNIILASCTQSHDFPIAGGGIQSSFGGGRQDGVILKFNYNLSNYLFGDYFGGSGDDACFVTSINRLTGNIYIAGATTSGNLPGNKNPVFGASYGGGDTDGFVTEIAADGSAIIKTAYMGTNGADMVYGLKFDRSGFPYIMGTTTGAWPVLNANYHPNPNSGQFISKLTPDLSAFVYSTVFGTGGFTPNISPIAFLVDRCENVYVSGWGGGVNKTQGYGNGTTFGLPEVDPLPGLQNFPPDGADFYFFVLAKNATSQLFGSHFGQTGGFGDHVDGGTSRFDENGVIYQAICANCGNDVTFPTTPNAVEPLNKSSVCNEAVVKIRMNYAGVGAGLQAEINGVKNDTSGCVPLLVEFRDTLALGVTYYWDFGDNVRDTTTGLDVSHTYNDVGHYHVMLIAEDLSTCNQRDTAYVIIRAGNNVANLAFTPVKDTPCTSTTYTFYNHSTPTFPPDFGPQSFTWDYGDGSAPEIRKDGRHTFPGPGIYTVILTLSDTNYCNSPVSDTMLLRVFPLVKADFKTSQLGCAPYTAHFLFTGGLAGTDFFWSFGDGTHSTDSTDANPTHYYPNPGVYAVQLIVRDTNTCNKIDTSAYFNITVLEKPVARFTWAPNPPQRNTATQFTNLSTGAVRYLWDFGEDGETSTEVNPKHQFNSTGTFTVTLTAYNQNNCDSTVSLVVSALVDPLLDVPNAFTPGRFGANGFVGVRGYGIGKMDWKIYNRWGQLVYHSNNRKQSWDGMYKGKLLPTEVYAYTLDVIFTDGKKLRKTGDITLLR